VQISVYGNIWKATMWQYKCVHVTVKETASQNSNGSGLDMVADINDSDAGTFGERDCQEWATLQCKITLYGFQ
jgi:hypothetical protein